MPVFQRADQVARRVVAWVDRTGYGPGARVVVLGFTAAWPLALDSDFVPDEARWTVGGFVLYLVLFGASALLIRHAKAEETDRAIEARGRFVQGFKPANAALAGAFEDVACQLARRPKQRAGLNEGASRALCTALLARIKSLATLALGADLDGLRLRVTLAVPLRDRTTKAVTHLRVWTYDMTYDDRRYTQMEIGWDGAPEAFRKRATAVIDDLHALDTPSAREKPRFRSIVCYPIRPRNVDSLEPLGVVSLDVGPPGFFTLARQARLNTYIQPAVQALGIPLVSRYANAKYTFGRAG